MRIATKKSPPQAISTASMPDIIFLLLIFFMVSTVFREFKGIPVRMPSAVNSMKIDGKRNISYCFVDVNDRISVDDKLLGVKDLTPVMYLKRSNNPRVIISLKVDENCKNDIIDKVHKALQEADARRIVYAAKSK
ncbi:TPA: biopolymer transporter ExbD [Candidatus Delongbacteria bacterium]|nr:MAG: hypothetical protein A2Y39_04145 [Candidatus Delongbacteria bacterium GWF2_40_14]HAQ61892.1 biopolymer transporter ExbD [Candidatus Delongbacteria bacterium]